MRRIANAIALAAAAKHRTHVPFASSRPVGDVSCGDWSLSMLPNAAMICPNDELYGGALEATLYEHRVFLRNRRRSTPIRREHTTIVGHIPFRSDAGACARCVEVEDVPGFVDSFATLKARTMPDVAAFHHDALALGFVAMTFGNVAVMRHLFDVVGAGAMTKVFPAVSHRSASMTLAHAAILRGGIAMVEALEELAGISFIGAPMDQHGALVRRIDHDLEDHHEGANIVDTVQRVALSVSDKADDAAAAAAADLLPPLTVARLAVRGQAPAAMLAYVERKFGHAMLTRMHEDQRTIAHDAVMAGSLDAVEAVRARLGADFLRRVSSAPGGSSWTVAHEAVARGRFDMLQAVEEGVYAGRLPFGDGHLLVHFAILVGRIELVPYLCKRAGAEHCATAGYNVMPVPHVAAANGLVPWLKVLSRLPDDGARWLLASRDADGRSVVHAAAMHGRVDVLVWIEARFGAERLMALAGGDDGRGGTAAHAAAEQAQVATLKHLLDRLGPEFVALPDKRGRTVESIAAEGAWLDTWERVRRDAESSSPR